MYWYVIPFPAGMRLVGCISSAFHGYFHPDRCYRSL